MLRRVFTTALILATVCLQAQDEGVTQAAPLSPHQWNYQVVSSIDNPALNGMNGPFEVLYRFQAGYDDPQFGIREKSMEGAT